MAAAASEKRIVPGLALAAAGAAAAGAAVASCCGGAFALPVATERTAAVNGGARGALRGADTSPFATNQAPALAAAAAPVLTVLVAAASRRRRDLAAVARRAEGDDVEARLAKQEKVQELATTEDLVTGTGKMRKTKRKQKFDAAFPKELPPEKIFQPSIQVGVCAPLGYFDPLGFAKEGDRKAFYWNRSAEIKHGRVAMMASIGLVLQHFVHFEIPSSLTYFKLSPNGIGAWPIFTGSGGFLAFSAAVFAVGFMELIIWPQNPLKEPGNFGDPLGLNMYNEEMRNKELNNGRFAMIATTGILVAEIATGKDAVEQLGLA